MKKLDGLTYTPAWISHMGCLSGCTRHSTSPPQTAGHSPSSNMKNVHESRDHPLLQ